MNIYIPEDLLPLIDDLIMIEEKERLRREIEESNKNRIYLEIDYPRYEEEKSDDKAYKIEIQL